MSGRDLGDFHTNRFPDRDEQSPEPDDFDAEGWLENELFHIFSTLERHRYQRRESIALIREVLDND
jgi:hypothetical protein